MYLKYVNKKDLEYLKEKYKSQIEHFLYKSDDCIYKNLLIYDFVSNSVGEKDKFIDCGAGPSALAWLLCDFFKDGYTIDVEVKNHFHKNNLHSNIGDFFSYMENHEDESINYALDGCSITHFERNEKENTGLKKAADILYKKIKKNGYFVMASDVISHLDSSCHNQTEYIKVKDMIKIYESKGFKMIGDFDYNSLDENFYIDIDYKGISKFKLTYCNLIFQKI